MKRPLLIPLLVSLAAMAACTDQPESRAYDLPEQSEASVAEREAARLLSIGSAVPTEFDQNDYVAAQLCILGIDTMLVSVNDLGLLDDAQMAAVDNVRETYLARAAALSSDNGSAPANVEADRDALAERYPDNQERLRIAMHCLRSQIGGAEVLG